MANTTKDTATVEPVLPDNPTMANIATIIERGNSAQPMMGRTRTVSSYIQPFYRYDLNIATLPEHATRPVVDVGAPDSPLRKSMYDEGENIDGNHVFFKGDNSTVAKLCRARYVERTLHSRPRLRELGRIVGCQLVCSDPECRHHIPDPDNPTNPETGKTNWIVDPTVPKVDNNCWHVSAVWEVLIRAEEIVQGYLHRVAEQGKEESADADAMTEA